MNKFTISLTVLIALLCFETSYAQKGFLKMGDIKGESTDRAHKDWIVIEGFSQALEQLAQTTGTTRRRGTVEFADVMVTKKADIATPKLMELCAKGQVIPEMQIELLAKDNKTFYKLTLSTVRISSIRSNAICNPECEVIEEFTLSYAKISWEYWDSNGNKVMSNYNASTGN